MRCRPRLVLVLLTAATSCTSAWAQTPSLVPLDDPLANLPLLPGGVNRSVPEVFGNYAHVWSLSDGTQVLQYYGDFALHLGERSLRSQDAVLWMQRATWENTQYYHFDVYLSRFAVVKESAGTVTTGPVLFVTFNTLKPAVPEADVFTNEPAEGQKLYQEAVRVRESMQAAQPSREEGVRVTRPGRAAIEQPPKARPSVRFSARQIEGSFPKGQEGIVTITGDVYVSQGLLDSNQFLEIRAEAAVLFLAQREPSSGTGESEGPTTRPSLAPALEGFPAPGAERPEGDKAGGFDLGGAPAGVAGVYLRGNVVMSRGDRLIRATELYYDFENDRALILDAVMRAIAPGRDIPIYVRAQRVRQLSSTEYFARKAVVTTSEFHTPHVHIGAERVYLTDLTPRDESGRITDFMAGRLRAYDATANIEGVPVAYWPYMTGDFQQVESPLKELRTSYSDDFGATFQTQWYLTNLLGLAKPQGVDAVLLLDFFSERGPAAGLNVDYKDKTSYGEFRGYYIHDTGKDHLGPFRDNTPDTENRGRLTWRHREFLPHGWELTLEGSYISDPSFLEEYFRSDWEEGKEQETLVYLKKQKDNWAFTTLAQWRVLDFLTQTEHLPDVGFNWVGEPIGEFASFFSESNLGLVRYRPDDRRLFDGGSSFISRGAQNDFGSGVVFRQDTRQEVDIPIKLGDVNIVPFAMGRAGHWDDSPNDGGVDRLFGQLGIRTGTQFLKTVADATSRLLDVSGIRHIIRPEITAWLSDGNRDSLNLFPFDQNIEGVDDFYGGSFALRQTWQTKRGPADQQRVVDWIKFDVEFNVFGNLPQYELPIGRFYDYRPEDSIARNHVRTDFSYRISDTTTILAETNWDLTDGDADLFDVSYAVERSPRLSYFAGYRRIHDTDSNLVGGGINYELNAKNRLAVRSYFDLERGQTETFDVTLVRKWPRWYTAMTFGIDKVRDVFNASMSVWPEGVPGAAIGSHRYTSLSESTGIRPER